MSEEREHFAETPSMPRSTVSRKLILDARDINQAYAAQFCLRIQLLCGDYAYAANRPRFAAIYRRIIGSDRQSKNNLFPISVLNSTAFLCASQ